MKDLLLYSTKKKVEEEERSLTFEGSITFRVNCKMPLKEGGKSTLSPYVKKWALCLQLLIHIYYTMTSSNCVNETLLYCPYNIIALINDFFFKSFYMVQKPEGKQFYLSKIGRKNKSSKKKKNEIYGTSWPRPIIITRLQRKLQMPTPY